MAVLKPKAKVTAEKKAPSDPSEIIDKWAEGFKKQLEPIKTFAEAIGELRESLAGIVGSPAGGEGPPAAEGPEYTISPLEYDGKAPWMLHPQVVKTVADELKSLIEYGADRLEGIMGKGPAPVMEEVEEEEVMLPSLITEAPAEEIIEEAPVEEGVEEEVVEVPVEEVPVEEGGAEAPLEEVLLPYEEAKTIPSLLEKDLPCAQCGRTDVPLLPSGLCEKCVKEISEKAPEEGKENE